jgi:D-amino-acid dehydrogenase
LLGVLQERENFTLLLNSEISDIYHDSKTGVARSIKILGKREEYKLDALVICTGASTPRFLKSTLGVRVPLMPIKSYSFDMPSDYKCLMSFDSFHAVWQRDGVMRVHGMKDYCGYDLSFDKRRVRNMVNIVAKNLNSQETMQKTNLASVISAWSPDGLPLVGRLKHYPNVLMNVGHGFKSSTWCFETGAMINDIVNGKSIDK